MSQLGHVLDYQRVLGWPLSNTHQLRSIQMDQAVRNTSELKPIRWPLGLQQSTRRLPPPSLEVHLMLRGGKQLEARPAEGLHPDLSHHQTLVRPRARTSQNPSWNRLWCPSPCRCSLAERSGSHLYARHAGRREGNELIKLSA